MTLAGTAAAVSLALVNERSRTPRATLTPAFVDASPHYSSELAQDVRPESGLQSLPEFLLRRLGIATLLGAAVLLLAGSVPAAITAIASQSSLFANGRGGVRPAGGFAGGRGSGRQLGAVAYVGSSVGGDLGAALLAGIDEQRRWDNLALMLKVNDEKQAADAAAAAAATGGGRVRAAAAPSTLNVPSGIGAGTVMAARITIYGCTGPGGGFCGGMSSGSPVFEGAAACSSNLPMGTRLRIEGDPTGRIYECLDRGMFPATWIDVYLRTRRRASPGRATSAGRRRTSRSSTSVERTNIRAKQEARTWLLPLCFV